jgi:hypothetical protein
MQGVSCKQGVNKGVSSVYSFLMPHISLCLHLTPLLTIFLYARENIHTHCFLSLINGILIQGVSCKQIAFYSIRKLQNPLTLCLHLALKV